MSSEAPVVFVEIPAGSRNKYEWDEELGGSCSTAVSSPR
jgi:Inorganic pyrophosphatase